MNSKKILIVSFYFPPYPKVGSRRWAKFFKYLKRNGHFVKVLCLTYNEDKKSPWDEDVKNFESDIVRIRSNWQPEYYRRVKTPKTFFEKIIWNINFRYHKFFNKFKKGNYLDSSITYSKVFYSKAKELIHQYQIENVVVTGSPFRYCYELGKLKKEFPKVNFIFDIRDFWEDWMFDFTSAQRAFERKMEVETLKTYDKITTPAKKIIETLSSKYTFPHEKFFHLPHAFDEDDYTSINEPEQTSQNNSLRLIYIGTLYLRMEKNIELLIDFMKEAMNKKQSVTLDIYSFTRDYQDIFEKYNMRSNVLYQNPIEPKKLFEKISSSYDIVIYQRSGVENDRHILSTKLMEQLAMRKPILYIGLEGEISDFICQNKLGFHLMKDNVEETVEAIIQNKQNQTIPDRNFPIEKFSFSHITRELEKLFV